MVGLRLLVLQVGLPGLVLLKLQPTSPVGVMPLVPVTVALKVTDWPTDVIGALTVIGGAGGGSNAGLVTTICSVPVTWLGAVATRVIIWIPLSSLVVHGIGGDAKGESKLRLPMALFHQPIEEIPTVNPATADAVAGGGELATVSKVVEVAE
jgi:hypothetical protein